MSYANEGSRTEARVRRKGGGKEGREGGVERKEYKKEGGKYRGRAGREGEEERGQICNDVPSHRS